MPWYVRVFLPLRPGFGGSGGRVPPRRASAWLAASLADLLDPPRLSVDDDDGRLHELAGPIYPRKRYCPVATRLEATLQIAYPDAIPLEVDGCPRDLLRPLLADRVLGRATTLRDEERCREHRRNEQRLSDRAVAKPARYASGGRQRTPGEPGSRRSASGRRS